MQVVIVDTGPSVVFGTYIESYDQVATSVFGGHPVNGKTLTLIMADDTEWSENSEGWQARWELSDAGENQLPRAPWLTW